MNRDREAERRRAEVLRAIPLTTVLTYRGAERDRFDRSKWHTERGTLSVTGARFWNWTIERGGGGAIDLVMHLADLRYRPAGQWLQQHLGNGLTTDPLDASPISAIRSCAPATTDTVSAAKASSKPASSSPASSRGASSSRRLILPPREDRRLPRVRDYLQRQRGLPAHVLDPWIASGKLYADSRSNAVFLLVSGQAERAVGAELRGTGPRIWRGLAPGTNKDAGYFWVGQKGARQIVLCESAIDALSCVVLFPERICLSTSGVRSNPAWLSGLVRRGYEISCGFDVDEPGERMATEMQRLYPSLHRLRPWAHDWNDALLATQTQQGITPG
jgi:hypothetical protein